MKAMVALIPLLLLFPLSAFSDDDLRRKISDMEYQQRQMKQKMDDMEYDLDTARHNNESVVIYSPPAPEKPAAPTGKIPPGFFLAPPTPTVDLRVPQKKSLWQRTKEKFSR